MKRCSRCKKVQPLDRFNKRNNSSDGRQPFCRSCNSEASKRFYRKSPVTNIERTRRNKLKHREVNRAKIIEYLQLHPCVDCGETDIRVLEFDHIRGIKKNSISILVGTGATWQLIEEEIRKCEVRCANDHRRRTYKGNYRDILGV